MDIQTLLALAHSTPDEPWGLGYHWLNDAESAAPYYRFLHHVVRLYKPKTVLETGVYLGRATAHMALANPTTHVIGVDIQLRPEALEVRESHCDNVHLVEGDSIMPEAVKCVCHYVQLFGPIELIFLDSLHDGAHPKAELLTYQDLLADECLIVCDDIHINPAMDNFWTWLPGTKVDLSYLHCAQYPGMLDSGFGISLWRRHEPKH